VEETFQCIWHDAKVGSGFVVGWCRFLSTTSRHVLHIDLALPEDDLSIIEDVSKDDNTCGHTAWTSLVNHYKDDGIYRCTELLQDLETPQADGESGIQYLNRLVRLQRQLARVGDVVHDRRIIMYLVKVLRGENHSITETWDVHNLSMDAVKRDRRQKGMRIESRAQSHTTEPPTPKAFAASHDDATTDLLKRQVSELQDQLKYLQGAATTRRASHGRGAARGFRGVCHGCGKKGHRRSECRTPTPEVTLRRWTPRLLFRRSWT
jgi:hypothetical protein